MNKIAAIGSHTADQIDGAASRPLFSPRDTAVDTYIETQPPERVYLLDDCLPYGKVGAIIGPGGVSKSQLALQLAVAVTTDTPAVDGCWDVSTQGSALCLFAEEDVPEIHRRLHHQFRDKTPEIKNAAKHHLHVASLIAGDNLLTSKGMISGEAESTIFLERLLATLEAYKDLKLIIIDPASRFRGGDENNAQDTTRFVEALEVISQATGATVLVIHHANKGASGGSIDQNNARGSSALVDGVRWVMSLQTMKEKETDKYIIAPDQHTRYLQVRVVKNNYAPPQLEPIWLERTENGILVPATMIPQQALDDTKAKREIIKLLNNADDGGGIFSKTGFINKYAGKRSGRMSLGRDALTKLLTEMRREGTIYMRTTSKEERKEHRGVLEALALKAK